MDFTKIACFALGFVLAVGSCLSANAEDKKKILFIAGKPSHASGDHEFRAGCMLLANKLNASGLPLEAKVHFYGWPEDESIFDGVDTCVIYADAGGRFGEKYEFLHNKVKKDGMGIMFMHYGVHPKKEIGEKYFKHWIGAYMDDHISVNPHWIADVEAVAKEQVARGVAPFKAFDEFYFNMDWPTKEECDCCRPLAVATPTPDRIVRYINMWNIHGDKCFGTEQALMWCRDPKPEEGGRGVGFVGGHYHRNWAIDDFRKLVMNAIVWTARMEVPKGGVPAGTVTEAELNENLDKKKKINYIKLPDASIYQQKAMERPKFDEKGNRIRKPKPQQKPAEKKKLKAKAKVEAAKPVLAAKPKVAKEAKEFKPELAPEVVGVEHFSTPEDQQLEVTLWAASPMFYNPTNMDIDHAGRIWVAEGVNYRRAAGRRPKGDRIMVLEDTDGDGKADKSHVFVQEKELECPLGVSVFDNKIYVPQPPNLVVYTDVNRDLKFDPKVDKKEILLTGFNAAQHDHSLHSMTAGPDGKFYFNNGNCGAIFTDKSGKTFNMNGIYRGGGGRWFAANDKLGGKKSDDGFVWTAGFTVRMNPDGTEAEIVGHGYRNCYEQSVNSYGDMFQSDNDDFGSCRNSYILEYGSAGFFTRDGQQTWRSVRRLGQPVGRAHWRQDDPGTFDVGDIYGLGSPTGNVYYENGALGEHWVGTYLACEPGRNTIFGYKPKPIGAGYSMDRFDFATSNSARKFIGGDGTKKLKSMGDAASQGVLFRPSDVAVGPDGAIYVVDWYDGRVGGHGTMDKSCSGAIYRIAPKGFKSKVPKLDLTTTAGLIQALKSPAVNVRHLGFKGLLAQGDSALDEVAELLKEPNKYIRARAIFLMVQLGKRGELKVISLLGSPDEQVRLVAYRALRKSGANMQPYAKMLVSDSDSQVRREVALSLRHMSVEQSAELFVQLARGYDGSDKNYLEALGLGAENKETEVWQVLKAALANKGEWSDAFAKITWRFWTPAALDDLQARAMNAKLSKSQRELAVESIAFIDHPKAAEILLKLGAQESEMKPMILDWLMRNGTGAWAKYDIQKQLKEKGIYNPDEIKNMSVTVPAPATEQKLSVARALKLTGDAKKGKATIMRCVMCHKINGQGPDYGPPLKGWGTAQSREAIIKSIIEPSADIAHGFRGTELILKDGTTIHGLVLQGDPAGVISTGGVSQLVPKDRIKSTKRMKRSLMLSAEQLGLTEQDVADIASYMQSWR